MKKCRRSIPSQMVVLFSMKARALSKHQLRFGSGLDPQTALPSSAIERQALDDGSLARCEFGFYQQAGASWPAVRLQYSTSKKSRARSAALSSARIVASVVVRLPSSGVRLAAGPGAFQIIGGTFSSLAARGGARNGTQHCATNGKAHRG